MLKSGDSETIATTSQTSANTEKQNDNQNEDDTAFPNKNKHPQFDRKIKVVGNDSFLKQIFS